jgi:hypothetical protein
MEQAIRTNYPRIHNKPPTTKEIEKIINFLKQKIPVATTKYL